MKLIFRNSKFIAESRFEEKDSLKAAGFRWDPESRHWWTDDTTKAAKFKNVADSTAMAAFGKAVEVLEASRATSSNHEFPKPEGLEYLPFQKAGIAYCINKPAVLMGDEPGLGKTIQAIGVINTDSTIKTVLIVCPASLKLNWKRELEKWLTRQFSITIVKDTFPAEGIGIINYDILGKWSQQVHGREWDLMIADESHKLKSPDAQRTQQVFGKWNTDLKAIAAKRRLFLTGTPILNRPIELWPMLNNIGLFKSWKYYVTRYCDGREGKWGWEVNGASNTSELQDKLRGSIMVRRLKKDVLAELPAKRRQVIELSANGSTAVLNREREAMQGIEDHLANLQADVELAKASSEEEYKTAVKRLHEATLVAFTEMAKVRHDTAVAKIPQVIDHLKDLLESNSKVVVFAHHHDVVNAIKDEFKDAAVVLTGETKIEDRQTAVDRFQNDPAVNLFIGSITAAGVGITLTAASIAVFAELDWVPGNVTQAEDRIHRISQSNSVLIQHLVLEGSLDSTMAKTLVAKQDIIDKALDIPTTPILPVLPATTSTARQNKIAEEAETISPDEIARIHAGLKMLSARCDGAFALDGMGFNKIDSPIGKRLAALSSLTPKQAVLGRMLVQKYSRQLE